MNQRIIMIVKYQSNIYSSPIFEEYIWDPKIKVEFDNDEKYELKMNSDWTLSEDSQDILSEEEFKTISKLLKEKKFKMNEVNAELAEKIDFSKEIEITDKLWIEEFKDGV